MEKGWFYKARNALDPKPEQKNTWTPAKGDIARVAAGSEFALVGLRRAGIKLDPEKTYQIRDYKKTEDGYLLSLDEVNIQYITGKRIVAVTRSLPDALSIDLFEPAPEHDERTA